ncbi:MAG: prepilin-type N-terminal cleavage/methylation domain-containing protein [Bacilli bacterium]|jgi:prepilin-type N-terminal cleavage/methylation domain-containing protein|nr:prepilin-type N-terminal cleavage/methylation domain-containing protein [Bacilli bacterium]
MNQKGITLIEFIVSIALVAVVMLFLFNLLIDVQYNSKNGNYAKENQLNRASIIRAVMDDFTNLGLVGITDSSTSGELRLTFRYKNGSSKLLSVGEQYVIYGDERWSMKSRNNRTTYQKNCAKYQFLNHVCCQGSECESNVCSDYFYVHIRIPVIVSSAIQNTIDDLEFFYVGSSKEIDSNHFPTKSYLGYNSNACTG